MGMLIANHDTMIDTKRISCIFVKYDEQIDTFRVFCNLECTSSIHLFSCHGSDIDSNMIYGERKIMERECPLSVYSDKDVAANILVKKMSEIWAEMDKYNLGRIKYIPETFKDFIKC